MGGFCSLLVFTHGGDVDVVVVVAVVVVAAAARCIVMGLLLRAAEGGFLNIAERNN